MTAAMRPSAAEQARWDSEARFEAVFDEAAIGIAVCHVDGTILEVNRSLCHMLGYPPRTSWSRSSSGSSRTPPTGRGMWDRTKDLLDRRDRPPAPGEALLPRATAATVWTDLVLSLIRRPGRPARATSWR